MISRNDRKIWFFFRFTGFQPTISKRLFSLLLFIFPLFFVIISDIQNVEATDNAFSSAKHGSTKAGENDAEFGGVRRKKAVGEGDESYYVYPLTVYGRGECTQCHEPHASFGGNEVYPSISAGHPTFMSDTEAEGPDPYLLFADNNSRLCWTCHETFTLTGRPTGWGAYGFFQGRTEYEASEHGNPAVNKNMIWPGISGATIHPRKARSGAPGICLNCHTPHGILGTSQKPYDIDAVPATKQTTSSNNSVTTDYLIPRQKIAWEEALCENCHDNNGPARADIKSEIDKRATGGSGHPVDDTAYAGRHFVNETLPIGKTDPKDKKHVECYDCHNPHVDKRSNRLAGMRYIALNGTVYEPGAGSSGPGDGRTRNQPYVYEVCFKCHSDTFNVYIPPKTDNKYGTTQPLRHSTGAPASQNTNGSNKRLEFNPSSTASQINNDHKPSTSQNGAYHPVGAPGRNTSNALARQLLGGLTPTSTIQCTDCHNSEATGFTQGPVTQSNTTRPSDLNSNYTGASPVGPHASKPATVNGYQTHRILRANYNTTLGRWQACDPDRTSDGSKITCWDDPFDSWDRNNFALCFLCHDEEAFTKKTFPVGQWKTNFYSRGNRNNLHAAHLAGKAGAASTQVFSACANCHYNVHSNIEAANTAYNSTCDWFERPSETSGSSRLINFSPIVKGGFVSDANCASGDGTQFGRPAWGRMKPLGARGSEDNWAMGCSFDCHGYKMEPTYTPPYWPSVD